MDIEKYNELIKSTIKHFWDTRNKQKAEQGDREVKDTGNRSSVTGGK